MGFIQQEQPVDFVLIALGPHSLVLRVLVGWNYWNVFGVWNVGWTNRGGVGVAPVFPALSPSYHCLAG